MEKKSMRLHLTRWLALLAFVHLPAACAVNPKAVDHTFAFDATTDSPGVTVLDYRYGNSNFPGVNNTVERRKEGRSPQGTGTTGPMPPGDDLYVKWRVNSTNQIFDHTADLRGRLPRDIDGKIVYFIVNGPELSVYLISRKESRPEGTPPIGPRAYRHLKTTKIYPE